VVYLIVTLLGCAVPAHLFAQAGGLDTSFNPGAGANDDVKCLAVQSDGKIVIGGYFTSVGGVARNYIARLNADGSLDTGFDPGSGTDYSVAALALQSDGKVDIGGNFTSVGGVTRSRVARLNADGSLDATFDLGPTLNNPVSALAVQSDGKILIGGSFTSAGGVARNYIARLNADGSLDTGFDPGSGANKSVSALAVQSDGKVVIGGSFTRVGGVARNGIARLDADGSVDGNFDPEGVDVSTGTVTTLAVESNGKIVIGGSFTAVDAHTRNYIARLNADGTVDVSFSPATSANTDDYVLALAVQGDGKVIMGYGDNNPITGATSSGVARLNADGSADASFNTGTGVNGTGVDALAFQADGKVVIGGFFTSVNGTGRNAVARLYGDPRGSLQFDTASYTVAESLGSVTLSVTRTGGSAGAVSVSYTTANVQAQAGSDYIATSGTLNWADGDTSARTISVPILNDSAVEGSESFAVILSAPGGGATLGSPSQALVTITDDDVGLPSPTITSPNNASAQVGVPFSFVVTASNSPTT